MRTHRVRLALVALVAALACALPVAATASSKHETVTRSGNGNARLGTVRLHRAGVLRWRATAGLQLYDRRGFMVLTSRAHHGRLTLRRGVYRGLRVVTRGQWRIVIRPRHRR